MPVKPAVIVDSSQSYYDQIASLNYAENLKDTQNSIDSVLKEIERLRVEREKLEDESERNEFYERLCRH